MVARASLSTASGVGHGTAPASMSARAASIDPCAAAGPRRRRQHVAPGRIRVALAGILVFVVAAAKDIGRSGQHHRLSHGPGNAAIRPLGRLAHGGRRDIWCKDIVGADAAGERPTHAVGIVVGDGLDQGAKARRIVGTLAAIGATVVVVVVIVHKRRDDGRTRHDLFFFLEREIEIRVGQRPRGLSFPALVRERSR
nr:hypothetical protein [Pandoravirus belohorizontensis]